MPASASGTSPGSTGRATYTQSRPAARNAALWIAGERLWRTGAPITAASRVDPLITPQPDHGRMPAARAAAMFASCWASVAAKA